MAIDIRAELQKTNDVLMAINAMARQGIEDGMRFGDSPHWAIALEFLAGNALNEISEAEMRLNALVGVAS